MSTDEAIAKIKDMYTGGQLSFTITSFWHVLMVNLMALAEQNDMIDEDAWRQLSMCAQVYFVKAGQVLILEGSKAYLFGILVDGKLLNMRHDTSQTSSKKPPFLSPGDFIARASYKSVKPVPLHKDTIVAETDSTVLIWLFNQPVCNL